jgi:hypothetical protein
MRTTLNYDAIVSGIWVFTGSVNLPDASVENSHFSSDPTKALSYEKAHHTFGLHYSQAEGGDVATATQLMYMCTFPAIVLSFAVRIFTAPTGGDKQYTVDLKTRAGGGAAWSSLLSSVITVSSADADNDVEEATLIGDPSLAAQGSLQIVVTATGTTGSQGQGMIASIRLAEAPASTAVM